MTKRPNAAQLALLDHIAVHGNFPQRKQSCANVLIREGWIEQRLEAGFTRISGLTPWYLTSLGSDVREEAQQ